MYRTINKMRRIDGSDFSDELLRDYISKGSQYAPLTTQTNITNINVFLSNDRKILTVEYISSDINFQPISSFEATMNQQYWYNFLTENGIQSFSKTREEIVDQDNS